MTNNQLCNLLGGIGIAISAFALGCMFFGMMSAVWVAVVGIALAVLSLANYD